MKSSAKKVELACRNVTEEDKNEIAALCQSRLEKWEKGNAR